MSQGSHFTKRRTSKGIWSPIVHFMLELTALLSALYLIHTVLQLYLPDIHSIVLSISGLLVMFHLVTSMVFRFKRAFFRQDWSLAFY